MRLRTLERILEVCGTARDGIDEKAPWWLCHTRRDVHIRKVEEPSGIYACRNPCRLSWRVKTVVCCLIYAIGCAATFDSQRLPALFFSAGLTKAQTDKERGCIILCAKPRCVHVTDLSHSLALNRNSVQERYIMVLER